MILAEEAQFKSTKAASSSQQPTRGRSRKVRRRNDDKTFFLPSRLSQSPYASSEDRSRSASRNHSASPYDAKVAHISSDVSERPSTTPAKTRTDKKSKRNRRQQQRPSSASLQADNPTDSANQNGFQAPPPTNKLFNVSHNVMQMRKELEEMSTMLLERGIIDQNPLETTAGFAAKTNVISRPQTSPHPNRSQQRDPFASPSTIYVMDRATVSEEVCILKFLLGPKDKDPKHYEDAHSMPLRIEGWDKRRARRIQHLMITAIDCDRIVGYCPKEIMAMGDEDKKHRCNKIVKALALKSMPNELEEWESEEEEEVEVPLHEKDDGDDDSVLTEGSGVSIPTRTVRQKVFVTKRRQIKRYMLQVSWARAELRRNTSL